jgi:hypothetical protein
MHSVKHYAAVARAFAEGVIPLPRNTCRVQTAEGESFSLRDLLILNPIHAVNLMAHENAISVEYRYAHMKERVDRIAVRMKDMERAPRLTREEAVMALASIRYQSCEHPGWNERGWRDAFAQLVPAGYKSPAERPGINAWSM